MKKLTPLAKDLRKRSTDTEKVLWQRLKAKQLSNFKFRRQQPIGPYIVDFVCHDAKIVIECDGGHHTFQVIQDQKRDQWLVTQGYRVLRFWDNEVLMNRDEVLNVILAACQDSKLPLP